MSDRFLEQRIDIRLCVKVQNKVAVTCAILSNAYGVEAMKKSSVLSGTNGSKGASMSKSQMRTMLIIFFDIKGKGHFEFISQGQMVNEAYYVGLREAVPRKCLNFDLMIGFFTITMLQNTRRFLSKSFWPRNLLPKWNTHPIPLIGIRVTCCCFQK
jgi:hypothetical protein